MAKKSDEMSLQEFMKFLQNNRRYVEYAALAAIVLVSVFIRTADMPHMGDQMMEFDSYLFYRYTEQIVDTGYIKANDTMRYYPFGFNTRTEATLHSYVMAYVYLALRPIIGWELITAFQLYPAIFGSLAFIPFYFLLKEVFHDTKLALAGTSMLSLVPSFLFRTSAGFSDKEGLAILLIFTAFLFYVKSNNQTEKKRRWLYAAIAGASTGLCGLNWGGVIFVFESIAAFMIVEVVLDRVSREKLQTYALWVAVMFPFFIFPTDRYGGLNFFYNSMTIPPLFGLFMALFRFYAYPKIERFKPKAFPTGIFTLVMGSLVLISAAVLILGPGFIGNTANWFLNTLASKPGTRHAESVSENQPPYFYDPYRGIDWWSSFSFFIVPFFGGTFLLMYEFMKPFKRYRIIMGAAFFVFVAFFIFSRFSSSAEYEDLNQLFADNYIYSFYLLIFLMFAFYLKFWDKKRDEFMKLDPNYMIILMWMIWTVVASRAAVRNFFSVTPPLIIVGAFFIVRGFDIIKEKTGEWVYGSVLYIMLILILFFGFNVSYATASTGLWPSATQDWVTAMEWVRANTTADAVFMHWWDYGYPVQTLGDRATVLDGGNYESPERAAMHFFTSSNVTEYAEVLEYYGRPTHMLLCDDDILKFYQIARIGFKDVWFSPFYSYRSVQTSQVGASFINATEYPYTIIMQPLSGPAPATLDNPQANIFKDVSYTQAILIPVGNNTVGQPYSYLIDQNFGTRLVPFNCVCEIGVGCIDIRSDGLPDCFLSWEQGAIYVPNKTRDMLFTRLYVTQTGVPGFDIVYDNGIPVTMQSMASGSETNIRIWEINYTGIYGGG